MFAHRITYLAIILFFVGQLVQGASLSFAQSSAFTNEVVLTNEAGEYPLGPHLEILEDPGKQLTIEDVTSPEFDQQFVPSDKKVPNFGYTRSAIWARFWVRNEATPTIAWRLEISDPTIDLIEFYLAPLSPGQSQTPGDFVVKRIGDLMPFTARDVEHRNFVFKLPLEPQKSYVIYLRVENRGSTPLPLTIWSAEAFAKHNYHAQLGFGFYYGFLFIMICYNLFLFAFLRERAYLYYVFSMVSMGLYSLSLDGLAKQYLWPNQIWWGDVAILVFIGLALLSAASFTSRFLMVKSYSPILEKIITAIKIASAGLVVLGLIPSFYQIVGQLLAILTIIAVSTGLVVGGVVWQRGYQPARYFLAAWSGVLIGAALVVLSQFILLPVNFWTQYSIRIGVFLLVLLWSLALADRINLLRANAEKASERLRERESTSNQFLEAMPVGVAVVDRQAKIYYVNQQFKQIFNLSDQMIQPGMKLTDLIAKFPFYVAETDKPYPVEHLPLMQALQGESVRVDDIEMTRPETRPETRPDRRVCLEVWSSPIFDEQGQINYAIAIFQDITERRQIASELNEYRLHLEEMVAQRTSQLATLNEQLQQDIVKRQKVEILLKESHQELRLANERLAVIHELGQMITTQLQLDTVLDILAHSIAKLLGTDTGVILLVDEETQIVSIRGAYGLSAHVVKNAHNRLGECIGGRVALTGKPLVINDLPNNFSFHNPAAKDEGLLACASVPLFVGTKVIGALSVHSKTDRNAFGDEQVYFLQMLAGQAAIAIENARLFEEERKAKEASESANTALAALNTIAFTVNNSLDLEADLEKALEIVLQEVKLEHGWVFLPEDNGRFLRLTASVGLPDSFRHQEALKPVGRCACEEVLSVGEVRCHFERNACVRLRPYQKRGFSVSSQHISLPISAKQEIIGLLNLGGTNITKLTPENYAWLETVAQQIGNAIENATLYQSVLGKSERLSALNRVSTIVSLSWELDEVLPPLLREMARVLETSLGVVVLRAELLRGEENRDRYRVRACFGQWQSPAKLDAIAWHKLPLLKTIEQTQAPLMIPKAAGDKRLQPLSTLIKQEQIQTVLILPLVVQNQLTGFITLGTLSRGRIFESAEVELARTLTNQAAVAIEKARLYEETVTRYEQELEIARQIQQNLLPHGVPEIPGLRLAGLCQPAYATGGDFYDYILLPDQRLGIVVSDVTGKSLPAAMVMTLARNTVRSELLKTLSPDKALTAANQWLYQDTQHNTFVATVQALIDPAKKNMWLVNAGQTAALLLRNGQTSYLLPDEAVGLPLGIQQNLTYTHAQIPLQSGDILLFYTDGIVEAQNMAGEMFSFDRLEATLQKLQNGHEPVQIIDTLMAEMQVFVGQAEQHDDITLVVVQVE
jgi:serine phosphatase RsbU (regulator of sigma subunit)/PAS domain-containing protein/putative methionine-R-sulfoxide reductase with GAF domain